ncbi:hypothetical protein PR048_030298 [Dryococelus australis]|uniref:Uncharacterized protein n=1 Tax=Dryococelus australis TaxID=614101 RepID=A0ABQ9G924_9NEOP|nr:hypothetical protein PR048_030298 [Dryococelus australis]
MDTVCHCALRKTGEISGVVIFLGDNSTGGTCLQNRQVEETGDPTFVLFTQIIIPRQCLPNSPHEISHSNDNNARCRFFTSDASSTFTIVAQCVEDSLVSKKKPCKETKDTKSLASGRGSVVAKLLASRQDELDGPDVKWAWLSGSICTSCRPPSTLHPRAMALDGQVHYEVGCCVVMRLTSRQGHTYTRTRTHAGETTTYRLSVVGHPLIIAGTLARPRTSRTDRIAARHYPGAAAERPFEGISSRLPGRLERPGGRRVPAASQTSLPLVTSLAARSTIARNSDTHSPIDSNSNCTPSPEACRNIYSLAMTIWKVQTTPSCAERTRSVIQIILQINAENSTTRVRGASTSFIVYWGRSGVLVRLLASQLCEQGLIPGGVTPGFSHVGIVPDDVAGWRVFSGIFRSPYTLIPALLQAHFTSIGSKDLDNSTVALKATLPNTTSMAGLPRSNPGCTESRFYRPSPTPTLHVR